MKEERIIEPSLFAHSTNKHPDAARYQRATITWLSPFVFFMLLHLCASPVFPAQEPEEIHEDIEVTLVTLYLTATDSDGNFLTDLKRSEITITEEGVPQEIVDFDLFQQGGKEPLTVVILIDTSVSMNGTFKNVSKIEMAKEGAMRLLTHLEPQDKMLLVTFSNAPIEVTEMTSDRQLVEQKIRDLKTDYGHTRLLDAVHYVAEKLKDEAGSKILFVCSDGQDNASTHKLEDVLRALKASSGITTMVLGTTRFESKYNTIVPEEEVQSGKNTLQLLAETTGGYSFFPENLKELGNAMSSLRLVIPSQYFISYHPQKHKDDSAWRGIEIICKRRGVKLHYRTGYFED